MRDWNLGTFMIFILVFLIVIFFIALNVTSLISTFKGTGDNKNTPVIEKETPAIIESVPRAGTYTEIENNVEIATKKYMNKYYPRISEGDKFVILISSLITEELLQPIADIKSPSVVCSGYTEVYNNGADITYNAFIRCGENYSTKGYSESFTL